VNKPGETTPSKSEHIVFRMVDGEAVLVEPRKGLVTVINSVGSRIWELVDGSRTASDIAEVIAGEYDTSPDTALKDAVEFLRDMAEKDLVTLRPGNA
jgi:hypothetical protein